MTIRIPTPDLPPEVAEEISSSIPSAHPLWSRLIDRAGIHCMLLPEAERLAISGLCLHDVADLVQTSSRALHLAKSDWLWVGKYMDTPDLNLGSFGRTPLIAS